MDRYLDVLAWCGQVVERDLAHLGFMFEHQRLDAQRFLLRQRRNRIWGSADLCSDESEAADYAAKMGATIACLESDLLFPFGDVFDESMPKERLDGDRVLAQLDRAVAKHLAESGTDNVFLDINKSDEQQEDAVNVATCIRPSHPIYSHRLGRKLTIEELWKCQGYFADDFPNPIFVKGFLQSKNRMARDLAGRGYHRRHRYRYRSRYLDI